MNDTSKVVQMTPNTTQKRNNFLYYTIRVAAVAAIVIGILWFIPKPNPSTEWQVVAKTDSIQTFELKDGSNIRLAENTVLSVDKNFNDDIRAVKLKGKAFFDVERDEKKPFVVYSKDAIVKVLGTSFSVEEGTNEKHYSKS